MSPEERLRELGLLMPEVSAPRWTYAPSVRTGNLVFVSGQIAVRDGKLLHPGKVGAGVSVGQAQDAARMCALQGLAVVRQECEELSRISRVVKTTVYVASSPGFGDQPSVANGASDLLRDVLGDAGIGARAAVGVAELPMGASVEAEFVFELAD